MNTRAWIWQLTTDYPGVEGDDTKLPIAEAWIKTHHGRWWMGEIYQHRLAPRPDTMPALIRTYADQDIGFVPWCVPTGHDPLQEADLANAVIAASGLKLVLDVEPYQWFWTAPFDNLHPFMQEIRRVHPNAWIGLSFDPRYGRYGQHTVDKYADIHFDEWLPYVDALIPQDYWGDFGVDAVWQIRHTWERIGGLGKEVIFALPGHEPNAELFQAGLEEAVRLASPQSPFGGVSLWRRGAITAVNWDIVRSLEIGPPPDPCADLRAELEKVKQERDRLLTRIGYAEEHVERALAVLKERG